MDEIAKGLVSGLEQAGDFVGQIQLFAIHKHKVIFWMVLLHIDSSCRTAEGNFLLCKAKNYKLLFFYINAVRQRAFSRYISH